MKQIIRGDKEPAHILAATRALEAHYSRYGEGNKYHPIIYSIAYIAAGFTKLKSLPAVKPWSLR